ncbi:very-long-chain enoyl-CoA reductase [Elysia marginata]|uniref:Very-long-chain enoyl-CoA reductase n=1 Tax=Elysia marginata TaxID=1093978 RepID=A0AAV4G0N8_9GAST|nr:very-long-chain enoyl-CoA reductase [Elysia marginata]
MFKTVKLVNQKKLENLNINDNEGKQIVNPTEIKGIITDHSKSKFRDESTKDINPFDGQARPLLNCITHKDIRDSINKLNNGRAPGRDNVKLCNEYLKYAPPILDKQIAQILNKTFESYESLRINDGFLITLSKLGKAKRPPSNLRPIILLGSLRKILSTIVLSRIRPKKKYLYRIVKADLDITVIWAHRWLTAKVRKDANLEINITGFDMSAAFDTNNKEELLPILKEIVEEDELRSIQFLLSETALDVKVNGCTQETPFTTNIGPPQGDSLSPVLLIIYLENALKDIRSAQNNSQQPVHCMPSEIIYADDIDFIGKERISVRDIEKNLKKHRLKVNLDKTKHTCVRKDTEEWKISKKKSWFTSRKQRGYRALKTTFKHSASQTNKYLEQSKQNKTEN